MKDRVCPTCRKSLPENAKFCEECGSRIDLGIEREYLKLDEMFDAGIIVDKTFEGENPFCMNINVLKDKIINQKLKPLPEKKKIVFREWKPGHHEAMDVLSEEESAEVFEEEPKELEESETDYEAMDVLAEEESAEVIEEEPKELEESETDYEAMDVLNEEENAEVIEEELKELEESETDYEAMDVLAEEESAEIIEEMPEELEESETVYEAMDVLNERVVEKEKTTWLADFDKIEESLSSALDNEMNLLEEIGLESDFAEETDKVLEERGNSLEGREENRVITAPINGGFKKREPQAEEIKDIGEFIKKWRKRR